MDKTSAAATNLDCSRYVIASDGHESNDHGRNTSDPVAVGDVDIEISQPQQESGGGPVKSTSHYETSKPSYS